jgi:hypothetical protein
MTQTISRMYDSRETADKAAEALKNNRFHRFNDVFVVSREGAAHAGADHSGSSVDSIVDAMMAAYILKAEARLYADGIQRGGALVTVHAPFGKAVLAVSLLDKFKPIDSGVPEETDTLMAWDDAAPCSSALRMPVKLDDATPFSNFWGVPVLLKSAGTSSGALGIGELSDSSKPFTGTFGMSLLSSKATPLSSMLGLPVLKSARGR